MSAVDVVVVSYNSRDHLRTCVEPLVALPDVHVIVVDNDSQDGSLETVADLCLMQLPMRRNDGFASGCNAGWRVGRAPYVLFLNPDATIDATSLWRLVEFLESAPRAGAAGPKILSHDGSLMFSQRRYPRLCTTYAQALFLHRVLPHSRWTDEMVRGLDMYERSTSPEWISGACVLVRRAALEQIDGFDESFFLYCEETDLCRRLRAADYDVRYLPTAVCRHVGGASGARAALLPVLAESRLHYARKHFGSAGAALARLGLALDALTHALFANGGQDTRAGHARALRRMVNA